MKLVFVLFRAWVLSGWPFQRDIASRAWARNAGITKKVYHGKRFDVTFFAALAETTEAEIDEANSLAVYPLKN
jgi:hypothetical protein